MADTLLVASDLYLRLTMSEPAVVQDPVTIPGESVILVPPVRPADSVTPGAVRVGPKT